MARAQKQGTLYEMHAKLCKNEANVAVDSNGELWHKSLGRMRERGMHILAEKNLLPKANIMHFERCWP